MTKRLFVDGLPDHVTGEILESFFSAYGTVESATVIIDKITDLSHGIGFVEMSTEFEAQAEIHNLDDTEVEGHTIKVHEARPRLLPPRRKKSWQYRG